MRKNRIIASLMALLMALSAFSGLCIPVSAAEDVDAVWTGLGFNVTEVKKGETVAYKINITDTNRFKADETEGSYTTEDGVHTISIFMDAADKDQKHEYLRIHNNATRANYYITDFEEGTVLFEKDGTKESENYFKMSFDCYLDKLFTMDLMLENATHALFVQKYTGEVACYDKKSEQILFSNPYDVSTVKTQSEPIYHQLMSQIILDYSDNTGANKTMFSYAESAITNQIKVKQIKGGIRIEYTLGRQEANYLVPRMISAARFDEMIMTNIREAVEAGEAGKIVQKRFEAFFMLKDPKNEIVDAVKEQMIKDYPMCETKPLYVLTEDIKTREIAELEEFIKTYCPDYTYDELDADHAEMGYEGAQKAPANFKMAIEYTLNENGFSARLPANGIRYDATNYTLESINLLPYMGAGSNENTGYIFLPDGSGSITRFEDYVGESINVAGTLYGIDYAYHTISGKLQETMRFPVFGIVENANINDKEVKKVEVEVEQPNPEPDQGETPDTPAANAEEGTTPPETSEPPKTEIKTEVITTPKVVSRGFLCIIEEGDAMVSIMSTSGAATHKYYNVETSFSPRQRDEYRLSDSISAASSAAVIIESKRKYVGSLTMKFVMLTDTEVAKENNLTGTYEPTWVGMASAYRDYLTKGGVLSRLTSENTKDQLPLYIETFGTVETTEKIASIPVTVDKALTSTDELKAMYNELAEQGITNINFKLKGYYNGGMYSTVPYKLDWQKAAGGKDGFTDLVSYSKEKGFGVYPDFDFAYVEEDDMFDGLTLKKHIVKTIDDRYSSRVMYSAATQKYDVFGGLCVSPSAFAYLFEGLDKNYSTYANPSISVATLGYALNSDFDEEDPYNREDSKAVTSEILSQISSKYENVMSEGGNAYTIKYIDHLLDASLDSSRYALTSAAVPFVGTVLHGSVNFAGSPINMEGDTDYALLKAIENGASLYFILSYNKDNTALLKEDAVLSQYYSIRYDIWKEDLISIYKRLNSTIGDLQTQLIVDHEFIDGNRVPDPDEAEADAKKEAADALAEQQTMLSRVNSTVAAKLNALRTDENVNLGFGYTLDTIDAQQLEDIYIRLVLTNNENAYLSGTVSVNEKGETVVTYINDNIMLTLTADKKVKVSLTDEGKELVEAEKLRREEEGDGKDGFNKYAATFGTLAKVVYENGATFILNYNDFSVTCVSDGIEYTIGGYSFVAIKDGKVHNYNSSDSIIAFRPAGSTADKTAVEVGASASIK